ncbi:hypothetical protein H8D85_00815 [bacterium]|nr:hypothetical protein [bacterium]
MEYIENKNPCEPYYKIKRLIDDLEEDAIKSYARGEKTAGYDFRRELRKLPQMIKDARKANLDICGPSKIPL